MSAPLVSFLIGGVQKGGTSALAAYLQRLPGVRLPNAKEAHVFDAPDFDEGWTVEQIDTRFMQAFGETQPDALYGDATPITVLHPRLVDRVARYNPDMRWIILLRDPVARAVSQHHMERARGTDPWPLWPALLLEWWRLRGHLDDFSDGSPLRHHSYLLRGDYARQLDALYALFPHDQVLLLRSDLLRRTPAATMVRVCKFLGLPPPDPRVEYPPVFPGTYAPMAADGMGARILRWWFRRELDAMRVRYGLEFSGGKADASSGVAPPANRRE